MLPRHIGEARQRQKAVERLATDVFHSPLPEHVRASEEFFESEKQRIRDQIGPVLQHVRLYLNAVLVAVYVRPPKPFGSEIIRPDLAVDEDVYQGTCGLVLKLGPRCFEDHDGLIWTDADKFAENDWIMFRRGDSNGFRVSLNGVPCIRFESERGIKMGVPRPDCVM